MERREGRGPAVGQLKLELLAEIAVGSTTRVDLCRSRGPHAPGELLAVKRLLPQLAHDPVLSQRFLDEVWMTSALRHPNVVRVIGWGNDDRGSYLAVELVQGVSLARLMKTVFETGEDFTERLAVYLGACIARGLGAAHGLLSDRGEPLLLVHRNLTPSNVLLGFQGDVKVADFGLAKAKQRLSTTTATSLPNRPSTHVSPEEIRGETVDRRSDLFSLGVVLYEVLTRKLPFSGANDLDIVQRIVREPPPDPLGLRPKLDRNLARLVLRCLEKDPAARFQTAEDVARELEGWLFAHGWSEDNEVTLGRFVRRNSMRQMHWFERAIAGGARDPAPRPPSLRASAPPGAPERPRPAEKSRAEVTAVERPARRRRSDSGAPPSERASRPGREGATATAPPSGRPMPPVDVADPPTLFEEDSEEAPTVAMRRDDLPEELLARLRATRGGPVPVPPAAAPAGVPRPGAASPRSKVPPPLPPRDTPRSSSSGARSEPAPGKPQPTATPTTAPADWARALERIRLEVETHRTSAASMRESARQLLAAADDEDAARARAESALAMVQEATAMAAQGATAEALQRLDEALRLAGIHR